MHDIEISDLSKHSVAKVDTCKILRKNISAQPSHSGERGAAQES